MNSSNSSNSSVEKCTCEKTTASNYPSSLDNSSDGSSISGDATSKDKKMKISLTSLGLNFRRGRSKRGPAKSKVCNSESSSLCESDKKSSPSSSVNKWTLRFNLPKKQQAPSSPAASSSSPSSSESSSSAVAATAEAPPPDFVKLCQLCSTKKSKEPLDEPGPSNAPQPATTWTGGAGLLFCAHNISSSSESTNISQVVISDSESTPDVPQQQSSEMSFNDSESESGKDKEVVTLSSQQHEAMENPLPPPPHQEGERTRGIYGIHGNSNCIILNGSWDMHWIRTVHEDCDEAARLTRAREIEQGVEAPANFKPVRRIQLLCSNIDGEEGSRRVVVYPGDVNVDSLKSLFHDNVTLQVSGLDSVAGCHTQVDFIHCLVPDMYQITQCSFYWGKMDRYEAERLLDGKPEGTFLLRDSAQEEFLFSVSFRKYSRSLHARVEQWNHKFSFDAHDPGVFTSDTVCGLMEHYKDPSSCMFFEPMLSFPLNRNFPFSLQHLCRSVIVNRVTYDSIKELNLPKSLKSYLKEYHYKQKVRVERFDDDIQYYDRSSSKDSGGMMANGKLL